MCDRVFTVLTKKATKYNIMVVSRAASNKGASSTASGTEQQVSRCRPINNLWQSWVEISAFRIIITILAFSYKVFVAVAFEASARLSSLLLLMVSSTFRSPYDHTRTLTCHFSVRMRYKSAQCASALQ